MQWTRERPDWSCSQLVCGVLWVQRTFLAQFYFRGLKLTPMLQSDCFRTPVHLRENVCVFRTALVHATKNSFRFWICLLQEAQLAFHEKAYQRTAVNALFHTVFTATVDTTKRASQVKTCDWHFPLSQHYVTFWPHLCCCVLVFVQISASFAHCLWWYNNKHGIVAEGEGKNCDFVLSTSRARVR